jgi:hypothetical protein
MSFITPKGRWCDIIVLKVYFPTEDKIYVDDIFYEELEHVFNKFHKHHTKFFEEVIFKPISNESLLEINNDNGVRAVKFTASKHFIVKSTMVSHLDIHEFN